MPSLDWSAPLNQGSGLYWQAQDPGVRMLGIIPSGHEADLHALWQVCAHLQSQGHAVLVLDGREKESEQAPGLQELIHPGSGFAGQALPAHTHDPRSIDSLPAARGLVQLAHLSQQSGQPPLALLQRHVRNHALVIVLAPAPLLAAALAGVQHSPTLLVPAQRSAVLQCYRSLKQVFMHTGQMPRLLALRPAALGLDPLLKSVAMCALHHLHTEPLAQQIDPAHPRQLHRWSLQCLEQAVAVQAAEAHPLSAPAALTYHRPLPTAFA